MPMMPPAGPVVTDVHGFLHEVLDIKSKGDDFVAYRGHESASYKLSPSIFRTSRHLENEDIILRKLIAVHPSEFGSDQCTLEQLVRVQHYSLPTRLLDITSNPLVALYFACQPKKVLVRRKGTTTSPSLREEAYGQVIVFRQPKSEIKFFDSDTVSCIANLAKLNWTHKRLIDPAADPLVFREETPGKRLLHFIRAEKPAFLDEIVPSDLERFVIVEPKLSNRRIMAQAGAFILFGTRGEMAPDGDGSITVERINVHPDRKGAILVDLDRLAINERTLFPEIDRAANYIKRSLGPAPKRLPSPKQGRPMPSHAVGIRSAATY